MRQPSCGLGKRPAHNYGGEKCACLHGPRKIPAVEKETYQIGEGRRRRHNQACAGPEKPFSNLRDGDRNVRNLLTIKEMRCFQSTVVGLVLRAAATKTRRKTAQDARAVGKREKVSDCATKGIFLFAFCSQQANARTGVRRSMPA